MALLYSPEFIPAPMYHHSLTPCIIVTYRESVTGIVFLRNLKVMEVYQTDVSVLVF